jgi:hypothetical protein
MRVPLETRATCGGDAVFAVIGLLNPRDNAHLQAAGPFRTEREAEHWLDEEHLDRIGTVVEMYAPDADD